MGHEELAFQAVILARSLSTSPAAPPRPVLSVDDKLARRKKQQDARKARKKNR